MAREYQRRVRVGEQIHRELADLVQRDLHDPKVGLLTIASVDVSPDLTQARVYYTVLGDESKAKESGAALKRATGFLRYELGKRLRLRVMPQLHFLYDATEQRAARLEQLLAAEKRRPASMESPHPDEEG